MSMEVLTFDEARAATNSCLEQLLARKIAAADTMSPRYGDLWRAADKLIKRGGKRLRPYMVHLSYQSYGGDASARAPVLAGCAAELLHVALLIHDDIIDRDTERYGIRNVSGQYIDAYGQTIGHGPNAAHYADSAALLAGDLLISEAYRLLAGVTDVAPADKDRAIGYFADSVFAVCGGELIDTESAFIKNTLPALQIAEHKTAGYSFIGPLLMGAALAGASEDSLEQLREFGRLIGTAYQLQDDLLGVFGDEHVTGKTTIGDIREGKQTFMVEAFYKCATARDIRQFEEVYGVSGLGNDEYHRAADLLVSSGAKSVCQDEINRLGSQAEELIASIGIKSDYKPAFVNLVSTCLVRDK